MEQQQQQQQQQQPASPYLNPAWVKELRY